MFDNMTGVVRSSVLEALLTSAQYSDRLLGQNRTLTLTNDRLWIATGNNARIGGDLARRCVFVSLDPQQANAHLRTGFDIQDLETWMRENRGEYLAALLTVARGWVLAGSPAEISRSDSFAQWSGSLRGLLRWAGIPGVFGAQGDEDQHADSEDDEEWGGFLAAVYDALGDRPFTAKGLLDSVRTGAIDAETLPGDLAKDWDSAQRNLHASNAGMTKKLGNWFRNRVGRYANGFKVERDGGSAKHGWKYAVHAPTDYARETPAAASRQAVPVAAGQNPFI